MKITIEFDGGGVPVVSTAAQQPGAAPSAAAADSGQQPPASVLAAAAAIGAHNAGPAPTSAPLVPPGTGPAPFIAGVTDVVGPNRPADVSAGSAPEL